ncbi:MFS transporter [Sphaerisporangium sp. B11E5]|uniref:MFS transporter n=1 Tax=Sphaerisporangium sp. B11E5 TaxID=3153563 RepID=UPI00325CCD10
MTITAPPVNHRAARTSGGVLAVVLAGQFMAILDVSIVNVAAPTVRAGLEASGSGLQLIISGYTVAYAMLLITGARLGGLRGARRVFLLGLAVFTAASLACGLAWSEAALIVFRLVQGAGAALMVPQVLSVIQLRFEGAARARALSAYSAVLAGGIVAGQVLGGALVSADLFGSSWRPVFLVNVPIGLVLLAYGARLLPRDHVPRHQGVDVPGLVTLSAAVCLIVVPLVLGHERHWPLWGWTSMAAGVVLAGVFTLVERRARHPLISGRLLRAPGLSLATLGVFAAMLTWGGFLFALGLYLQGALGDGPMRAGLTFASGAAGFAGISLTWQRLPARLHRALIPAGFVLAAAGYLGIGGVLAGGGHGEPYLEILLLVAGAGLGAAYSPLFTVALARVAPADAPDASGLLATTLQLGQVVGVATFGSLFLGLGATPHALAVTQVALTVPALIGAGLALPLLRR